MSKCYVIADTHFGHRNIIKWRDEFETVEEHDNHIIEQWNKTVRKRDTVFVLGDVAFDKEALSKFKQLNGRKVLVAGNHDDFNIKDYVEYFDDVRGAIKRNGVWLTHIPIHDIGARDCLNIHGHLHRDSIKVEAGEKITHVNVCCEMVEYTPVELDELIATVNMYNEASDVGKSLLIDAECSKTIH